MRVEFLPSLTAIEACDWNRLCGTDYPFLRYEFLSALEASGSAVATTGWQACHAVVYEDGQPIAVMPLYIKSHSQGEYVFDWSWADAWQRAGEDYYPKLLTAIPFTPCIGPRLGLAAGVDQHAVASALLASVKQLAHSIGASGWHLLFAEETQDKLLQQEELLRRIGSQFHWYNRGYSDFDHYLQHFNSRKRKTVRKERRSVEQSGIRFSRLQGAEITDADWDLFYQLYHLTYFKRMGRQGYLNREFFALIAASMADQLLLIRAERDEEAIAMALFFRSSDTLYGRYWGCAEEFEFLHFETCYYQGIDYCLQQGLQHFDSGAQGEHKIQRGFEPMETGSRHWLSHPQFSLAIGEFLQQEASAVRHYIDDAKNYLPFKQE